MIKLPIGDFELGTGFFGIKEWGFKSPIPNPKTQIPNSKSPIDYFMTW